MIVYMLHKFLFFAWDEQNENTQQFIKAEIGHNKWNADKPFTIFIRQGKTCKVSSLTHRHDF